MNRYDWPAAAESGDDPGARAAHVTRYLPSADVPPPEGWTPPKTARGRRGDVRPKRAPGGGLNLWLPIGPTTVMSGQATGRPEVSGRVMDLAVSPDGTRVYAATANGGVWFSDTGGVSWRPLDEFVTSPNRNTLFPRGNALSCGALFVHFGGDVHGADDDVVVGTGEPLSFTGSGSPSRGNTGVGFLTAHGPASGTAWTPDPTSPLRGQTIWAIAADPGDATSLIAATDVGVYRRSGGTWSAVPTLSGRWSDVVVTRSATPNHVRVWSAGFGRVRVADGTSGGVPPAAMDFSAAAVHDVPISGFHATERLTLATSGQTVWVLGIGPDQKARVQRIDATGPITTVPDTISGVPEALFGEPGHSQAFYDTAIEVHPDHPNVLYVGGSATEIDGEWNASLYRLEITGTTAVATSIGGGVHPDVHTIAIGPAQGAGGRSVWVGCDGGVFMSSLDGAAGSFLARNNNLSSLEPGFVACHPTNDGLVVAGMQDNGTCERRGDGIWALAFFGDGGGVAYDAGHVNRYYRQYTNAVWQSSDHTGVGPVHRFGSLKGDWENASAAFYSGMASVTDAGTTHLVVLTHRPWHSADWGQTWATVPTGTDPRGVLLPNLAQDSMTPVNRPTCDCSAPSGQPPGLLACRLAPLPPVGGAARVLLAVLGPRVQTWIGTKNLGSGQPAWRWTAGARIDIRGPLGASEGGQITGHAPLGFLPSWSQPNDLAIHEPRTGADATCYLATAGGTDVDTVYWYDGAGHVHPCGLRLTIAGCTWAGDSVATPTRNVSPALAVAVDPDDAAVVYVGTSVGVVRGRLTITAGTPTWAWEQFDNGLPEAAVHDLAIFRNGGVKLLRAALQSRGVWEVDLATPVATPRTFLRVFASDTRRRLPTSLTGPTTAGEPGVRWDASPDIRLDETALVWPAPGPDEADLFDGRFNRPVTSHASQRLGSKQFRVHVLVHHRWFDPLSPAELRVVLARHHLPDDGVVDAAPFWQAMLTAASTGNAPVLPADWLPVGGLQTVGTVQAPVTAREPRTVTFTADLSAVVSGARQVLVAVVLSAQDGLVPLSGGPVASLQDLVLRSRHVAARSIQVP